MGLNKIKSYEKSNRLIFVRTNNCKIHNLQMKNNKVLKIHIPNKKFNTIFQWDNLKKITKNQSKLNKLHKIFKINKFQKRIM
jgi:DUF971 family protein